MLSHLTIVDLSRLMPGPFCTMLLADLGARVIAIESPWEASDVTATSFPSLLRNKERMVLDLKRDAGRAAFFRLVTRADAVVEGFRPGTLGRLGITHEAARAHNPAIVYASITGYGQTGKEAHKAGHDINFLARSGILDLMVPEDADPTIPAIQFADMTGAMVTATTLLAAISEAQKTGLGRHLDVSMTDAALSLAITSLTFLQKGWPYGANTSLVGGGLACYGAYRTKDGRLLAVGALEASFFANLCRALDLEELIPHQYSGTHQPGLRARLEEVFLSRNYQEWVEFFSHHDACVTGALRFQEALADPQFAQRGAVRTAVDGCGAGVQVHGMALPYPGQFPPGGAIPCRGEHNEKILGELGYSPEAIAALLAAQAVSHEG